MSGQDGDGTLPPEEEEDKTAALSLEDLDLDDDDGGEKTAAISLAELGISFDDDEPAEEAAEKTAAMSLDDMGLTPEAPAEDAAEEAAEKTAAMSLEEMGLAPEAAPEAPAEEAAEKTAAMSLEDMGLTPEAPAEDAAEEAAEKTAAMSLEEMGLAPEAPAEAPAEEAAEKTAAMSLEEMGLAPEAPTEEAAEKTAAMSLEDMGIAPDAPASPDEEQTAAMNVQDVAAAPEPPAPKVPPPELQVHAGNDRGESFTCNGDSLLVGRGLDCDIVLNDASVSRNHFRLDKTAQGYRMVDLGSGNGTKINGVRLSEFDLADGTVIEAGTTKMTWSQPDKPAAPRAFKEGFSDSGEATRVSDLAAINILPEWEEQVEKEEQVKAVIAQRGPLKMIVMLLSIVLVLGGGLVGLDKALNMGIVFDDGSAAEADKAAAAKKREAIELMDEGRKALSEQEWSKARKAFKAAMEADEEVRDGQRFLDTAKAEAKAFKAFRKGRSALDEENYEAAIAALKTIEDTSLYFGDDGEGGDGAKELLTQAVDNYVEAQLVASQQHEEAGDTPAALAAIDKALALAPKDAAALALKAELSENDAGEASGEEAAPTQKAQTSDDKGSSGESRRETAKREVANLEKSVQGESGSGGGKKSDKKSSSSKKSDKKSASSKKSEKKSSSSKKSEKKSSSSKKTASKKSDKKAGKKSPFSEALGKYASGSFDAAVADLKKLSKRGSRKDRAKAKRLAGAVAEFKGVYASAMASAKGFRSPKKAAKQLRAARKLDTSISGAYSKKIRGELAKQLTYLASQAWSAKKYGKAGRYARKALALDPNQAQAKKIYTEVQAEAQGWFDQAKKSAKSNPDKAMQLLSRVVSIFPKEDARYKEAYKLLNELASEEED